MASRSARPSIACSRRDWFGHAQNGLMAIALSQLASDSLLAQSIDASTDKAPHHQSRAKAVIQLYAGRAEPNGSAGSQAFAGQIRRYEALTISGTTHSLIWSVS